MKVLLIFRLIAGCISLILGIMIIYSIYNPSRLIENNITDKTFIISFVMFFVYSSMWAVSDSLIKIRTSRTNTIKEINERAYSFAIQALIFSFVLFVILIIFV
jgi:hypothetical protein